jgi:Sap-like sulfolipid-1-addressing protein
VSAEALVLALTSVVRPTTLAAVYAMMSRRGGQRLLIAYLVIGLSFSLVVGIVVVVVLRGYTTTLMSTFGRAVVDVAIGAAACGYATGVGTRRRSAPSGTPSRSTAWLRHRLDHLTVARAGLIGVVTHLPGLVYLAALNAIVGDARTPEGAVTQVALYNAIWYSVAIGALLISAFRPAAATDLLKKTDAIIRRNSRTILVALFGVIGVYFLGKGLSVLLGW